LATSRRRLKDSSANLMILQRPGLQSAARAPSDMDLSRSRYVILARRNSSLQGAKRRVSSPFLPLHPLTPVPVCT